MGMDERYLGRVTFGMVPTRDDPATRRTLNSICEAIGRLANLEVTSHRAPSPLALASAMSAGRVHFAWMSPTLVVLSEQLAAATPILSTVRRGQTSYHAVLFTRDDSPIRRVDQLAGRSVAWVATSSAAGYIVPRISLARQGIDPSTCFSAETFCDSHPGVVRAVVDRRADVGATHVVFDGGRTDEPPIQAGWMRVTDHKLRMVDIAGPIPSDLIVAAPGIAPAVRHSVARAFRQLAASPNEGEPMRSLIGADGFEPFSARSLEALMQMVASGREVGAIPGKGGG